MTRSQELYQRALLVLPGGVSRNAVLRQPHPCYAERGEGCYVLDIEGKRRLDFGNNMASLIHGHAHPNIVEAVTRQLAKGTAFSFATEAEILLAEHVCSRAPGFEQIRFVNSGSEAVICCLKAARAFTGRAKIAKVEGAYHGLYDFAEVSQTASPVNWGEPEHPRSVPVCAGTPDGVLGDVVVIPFNQPEQALAILDQHADTLACVLVDPLPHRVGLMPAAPEFIAALRHWTQAHESLLVFDEVITFRSEYGGAQQWFSAQPDLTALGKMIGGGFPVGAITGRRDVMEVLNPLAAPVRFPHSGTFSANPVTMVAGLAALELFNSEAVARLNALGTQVRHEIEQLIRELGLPACVTGAGSMFRIHFKPVPPRRYREAFASPAETRLLKALLEHLFSNGIALINSGTGALSSPMAAREVTLLLGALRSAFGRLKEKCADLAAVENQSLETKT
jgi:glutamate-1-semialdehyde 2,1-aminomutase